MPYFFEVTTFDARNSNDTFRLYNLTNPPTRTFDEGAWTWDHVDNREGCGTCGAAAPLATNSSNDFSGVGENIGVFFAPEPAAGGVAVGIPILGSDISTFVDGNTFASFGITSTETNRLRFSSKESGSNVPRLYTYDVIDSLTDGNVSNELTWLDGAPTAGNFYRVNGGDKVSISNGPFAGEGVIVENGTLEFCSRG